MNDMPVLCTDVTQCKYNRTTTRTSYSASALQLAGDDIEASTILRDVMEKAKKCSVPKDAAWALRHGFDALVQRGARNKVVP
jgi:transcriptional/translational regulatory protein YebC/TACO1